MHPISEELSDGFSVGGRLVFPRESKIVAHSGEVLVEPKLMELLVFLAHHAGNTLTRDQIFENVWSDSFVSDAALYKSISNLRRILEDDPQHPTLVITVPKLGYRLNASIEPIPEAVLQEPSQAQRQKRLLLIGLLAVPLLAFVGWWFLANRAGDVMPAEMPTVLLAQLDNQTGQDLLEGTLEVVLEGRLNDSERLRLVSRPRIENTLALMRLPANTPLSTAVARQVSLRDGEIDFLVSGQISRLGRIYQVSLQLMDATSQELLASNQRQTDTLEELIPLTDELSSWLLEQLEAGSSTADQEPTERVTTNSLEALRLYTRGSERYASRDYLEAITLFEEAVEIDPEFASAYLMLAFSRFMADNHDPSRMENVEVVSRQRVRNNDYLITRPAWAAMGKAMELRHLTSFVERSFIQGCYYDWHSDLEKAAVFYKLVADRQPEHQYAGNNLVRAGLLLKNIEYYAEGMVAQARARPYSLGTQVAVAGSLIDHGFLELAAKAIERIRTATAGLEPSDLSDPSLEEATAWLWSLSVWKLWLQQDYPEAFQATDRLTQKIEKWQAAGANMQEHAYFLAALLLLQGRLADAKKIRGDFDLQADYPVVSSPSALLAFLSESAAPLGPPTPERWKGRATLRPVARILFDPTFVSSLRLEALPESWRPQTRTLVEILLNRSTRTPAETSQALKDWLEELPFTFVPPDAPLAVRWTLARELDSAGRDREALEVRQRIFEARRQTFAGGGILWQKASLELACSYQQLGRLDEAEEILSDLRAMLQFADPDHPLLQQLSSANGSLR